MQSLSDSDLALEDLNKALEIKPDYLLAERNKVVYYHRIDNCAKLISLGMKYSKKDEDAHIFALLGECFNETSEWEKAKTYLTKSIKLNSKNPEAFKERGQSNRMLNLYDHSLGDFNQAIKLKPEYNQAYNSRA